jgi:cytochrome P450
MSESEPPRPPGSDGPPLLGETLKLLHDPFAFVESRAQRLGAVFRTRVLGRPTAVITGPDATAKFVDDADVQRAGAMPGNIQTLFGGRTLPVLDGDEHRARKRAIMAAFSHEAIAAYVPQISALMSDALARWAAADEVHGVDELRRMALETICRLMVGAVPGPALDRVRADYGLVLRGFKALPIPLPGTDYARAKAAIRRVLHAWRAEIRNHEKDAQQDGLSRILAARGSLDADAIARELHHLVLAGLIVWAWCARLLMELEQHPGVRARLLAETAALPPGPPDLQSLQRLTYLEQVACEIRRITPVVPVAFGKARRTFVFGGHTVPAGWMVLWGTTASHARPDVYPSPERFDPERFAPDRAGAPRHPDAFAPNGGGDAMTGHKCAGYALAPTMLKLFAVEVVRGYTWLLTPGQDLAYDWTETPPAFKDGLRLRLRLRAEGTTPLPRALPVS